jgi:DeoR family ulaG and ulaABCDEF operon transcriptional repressor
MHATEREKAILRLLKQKGGFVSFREIEQRLDASPATLRRDLGRLAGEGHIDRVRGGAMLRGHDSHGRAFGDGHLAGTPFEHNVRLMPREKRAIGRAAAELCRDGTSIMIDGGSTTLRMCRHLAGRDLQVFTNSLHIVRELLPQPDIRILVPGGSVFREQDIILSVAGDDTMPRFHAPQFFMGAASVGAQGVMNSDILLVTAERRLIDRADELIVLVDHTKFQGPSGNVVCGLEEVDLVITDSGARDKDVAMLEAAGIRVVIAPSDG